MRNIKKKIFCIILVMTIIFCNGCSKNEVIVSAFEDLYASNFTYTELHKYSENGQESYTYSYDGEYTAESCMKHLTITEGDALWSELYVYEENNAFKGLAKIEDEWQEVKVVKDCFDGYEERHSIQIKGKEEKTIEGIVYDVYKTEYTVDLDEKYQLEEELETHVTQEYYVNQETGRIEKIISDTTEFDKMTSIAIMMQVNGTSFEEAAENENAVKPNEAEHLVEICILYQGEDFKIELPELVERK